MGLALFLVSTYISEGHVKRKKKGSGKRRPKFFELSFPDKKIVNFDNAMPQILGMEGRYSLFQPRQQQPSKKKLPQLCASNIRHAKKKKLNRPLTFRNKNQTQNEKITYYIDRN